MYSTYQAGRSTTHAGEPLPTVFPSLARNGAQFVRGQLVLVASSPGTGKSALALWLAIQSGATTMYYSADSDGATQQARAYAMQTGCTVSSAMSVVQGRDKESLRHALHDRVVWDFSASPTPAAITRALHAYYERYGEFPELVILDNVLDVVMDAGVDESMSETSDSLMAFMHEVARDTGACVLALHHVTGGYNNGDKPVPLSGTKGQIARTPELVLTLHGSVNVSVVKNRNGWHDKTGERFIELGFEPERMRFSDDAISER